MKKTLVIALCGLFSLFATGLFAQQAQPQRSAALLIGVVDLPRVLQAHPIASDEAPVLRDAFMKEQAEFQRYQQSCQKQADQILQQYKLGTPQYEEALQPIKEGLRQAEIQLQDKQAQVSAQMTQLQYQVYTDVQKALQQVATQKSLLIVFTKIKLDRDGVAEELAALQEADTNQLIAWNHPACDITEDVKTALAQIAGTPKNTASPESPLSNISGQIQAVANQPAENNPQAAAARPTRTTSALRSANAPAAARPR